YLAVHSALGMQRDLGLAQVASMDVAAILDSGDFNHPYHGRLLHIGRVEGGLFPGFVALGFCLVAVAWLVLRAPPGHATPDWPRWARCGVALAAVGTAGALVLAGILSSWHLDRLASVRGLRDLTWATLALPALALLYVGLEGRSGRTGPFVGRDWIPVLAFLTAFPYPLTTAPP